MVHTFCKLLLHFPVKVLISFSVLLSCLNTLSKDDNIGILCIQLLLWALHLLVQLVSLHLEFFRVSPLALCRCCRTNSSMASSLVLCSSTVGFIAGSNRKRVSISTCRCIKKVSGKRVRTCLKVG